MSINCDLGGLIINDIVCINLKHRKDRRIKIRRESRKKNFPVSLSRPDMNKQNPKLGKWNAHMNVWRNAIKHPKTRLRKKYTLILEDDVKILISKLMVPVPPEEWDMLYLGGNIQRVITDEATDTSSSWKRVCTLMTHAYIISDETGKDLLKKAKLYLSECKKSKNEILDLDKWLCTKYHTEKLVYTTIPDRIIQRDGYSDVKKSFVTFNQQLTDRAFVNINKDTHEEVDESKLIELAKTPMETTSGKDAYGNDSVGYILKLPKISTDDLPNVTLITSIRNNKSGFYFVVRNFYKLEYPKEKITWIIADDSEEGQEVRDLIPGNDQRIKYISCKMGKNSFLPISKKINLCMNYVTNNNEYIVHFSDNQYYPPMSVLSRVKVLMSANKNSNNKIKCTGSTEFGVFDIVKNKSYQKFYPDANNNKTVMYGPSLCYLKEWWDVRKFDENRYVMETFYFTRGRLHQVIEMPYQFISTTLAANDTDATEADRYGNINNSMKPKNDSRETFAKYSSDKKFDNFFDGWDKDTQNFVLLMKETLND